MAALAESGFGMAEDHWRVWRPGDGRELFRLSLPAAQTSCPAFIGADLNQLLVTSAAEGLNGLQDGQTWLLAPKGARGRPEPRVTL